MQLFHNLSFKWKISIPLLLIVLLFVISSMMGINSSRQIAGDADKVGNVFLQQIVLLLEADRDLHQALIAERALVHEEGASTDQHQVYQENSQQFQDRIDQAFALGEIENLNAHQQAYTRLYNRWSEVSNRVLTLVDNGQFELAASLSSTESRQAFDELRNLVDVIQGEQIAQSDFYTSQAMERSDAAVVRLLSALVVGMIISVLMVVFVPPLITRPLLHIRRSVESIASGNGDLTARITVSSTDEVGDLGGKFNLFIEKLHTMVSHIKACAIQVSDSSSELAVISSTNRDALNTQNQALETVVSAVHEMSKAINEVSHNTTLTAEKAQGAQTLSSNGLTTVNKAVNQIQAVSAQVEGVSELLAEVESQVTKVTTVLDVIQGIAEQTNLLALNAAIEAARAGEQGRGFAVVADEVRTLANRTQESTTDIQSVLEKLQLGVADTVSAMHKSASAALDSVNTANEGGKALSEINDSVASIADMTVHVAAAVEEQSVVIEEINQNLASISEQSVTTSESATKTDQSSQGLGASSRALMENVGSFKL